jgi:hypothetical protein
MSTFLATAVFRVDYRCRGLRVETSVPAHKRSQCQNPESCLLK